MAAVGEVACDVYPENPHYTPRASSVIFKTRITCQGNGISVVQVRMTGILGSIPGAPPPARPPQGPTVTRTTSDKTQNITVNGESATYYTPLEGPGEPKVRGSAWYQGYVTGQIVGPPGGTPTGPARGSNNRAWVRGSRLRARAERLSLGIIGNRESPRGGRGIGRIGVNARQPYQPGSLRRGASDVEGPGPVGASVLRGPGEGFPHIPASKFPFLRLVSHEFGRHIGVRGVMPKESHPEHWVVQFPRRRPQIDNSNLQGNPAFLSLSLTCRKSRMAGSLSGNTQKPAHSWSVATRSCAYQRTACTSARAAASTRSRRSASTRGCRA